MSLPARSQPGPQRRAWPAALVDRGLAVIAADLRRAAGPAGLAALLSVAGLLTIPAVHRLPGAAAAGLALAATAPLAGIRRWPGPVIAMILAASAVFLIAGRLSWPVPAMAGWLAAVAAAPLLLRRALAVTVLAGAELLVAVAAVPTMPSATPWDATVAEALAVIVAWGAGDTLRLRRQGARDLAAAAERERMLSERAVLDRGRAALAGERATMARELHDVIAHHMSMIAVRAGTAPYAIDGLPGAGREAFDEIAREARMALAELRMVLGVLRAPGAGPEAAPQPGVGDLATLLARARGAGTSVTQTVTGTPRPLPAPVELCAYRVVQESVTNAGRHATGSDVDVAVTYKSDELAVTVRNGAGHGTAAPGGPPGSGFGLLGLRERVAILGGQMTARPLSGGGFEVAVTLPDDPRPVAS